MMNRRDQQAMPSWIPVVEESTISVEWLMKTPVMVVVSVVVFLAPLTAQEEKPVPKDSVRVSIPGCASGRIFTAGPRTVEHPGTVDLPPGMHLRMNGPKKMMAEIKAHEASMIEITGLMKKGQYQPDGVGIGGGVRITPGPSPTGGNMSASPNANQIFIDVEGWRQVVGNCPTH